MKPEQLAAGSAAATEGLLPDMPASWWQEHLSRFIVVCFAFHRVARRAALPGRAALLPALPLMVPRARNLGPGSQLAAYRVVLTHS